MKTPGLYVPLDVNYVSDEGIRRAGAAAELLYIRGLAYSKRTQSDGFLPDYDMPVISVGLPQVRESIVALVERELWIETDGGWQIRSWRRWNEMHGDAADKRKRAAERQRRSRERKAAEAAEQAAREQTDTTDSHAETSEANANEEPEDAGSEVIEGVIVTEAVTRDVTRTSRVTSRGGHATKEKRREETTEEKATTSAGPAKTSQIRSTADADFDEFYAAYPRHQGKADAAKAYRSAIKAGVDKQKILAAVQAYAAHTAGKDPEFIKLPAGWLRAARYDDELPAPGAYPPLRAVSGGYEGPWTNPADQDEYNRPLLGDR